MYVCHDRRTNYEGHIHQADKAGGKTGIIPGEVDFSLFLIVAHP